MWFDLIFPLWHHCYLSPVTLQPTKHGNLSCEITTYMSFSHFLSCSNSWLVVSSWFENCFLMPFNCTNTYSTCTRHSFCSLYRRRHFSGKWSPESRQDKKTNTDGLLNIWVHTQAGMHSPLLACLYLLNQTLFPPTHARSLLPFFSCRFLLVFCWTGCAPSLLCSLS